MEDLDELIAQQQGPLFAFLYRACGDPHLAEELMQETFVRALQAAQRYRPQASVTTWLLGIAHNLLRDRWRHLARHGELVPLDRVSLTADSWPEADVLQRLHHQQVRLGLLQLPLQQRSALILRYYHDLSYAEIAQLLACPLGTVRSRLHNGLARLKELLAEEVVLR